MGNQSTKSKVTVNLQSELEQLKAELAQAKAERAQAQAELEKAKKAKAYNYSASLNDNLRTRSVIAFLKDVTQDYESVQKTVQHSKVAGGYLGSVRIAIHAMIKDETLRKSVINQLDKLSS